MVGTVFVIVGTVFVIVRGSKPFNIKGFEPPKTIKTYKTIKTNICKTTKQR